MQRLRWEMLGSHETGSCACCGAASRTVWGGIYAAENSVYYVSWTVGHLERGASFFLSINGWGEGADPANRRAVALECRVNENGPGFMAVDAAGTRWADKPAMGRMLSREQALAMREDVFSRANLILAEDDRVRRFLYPPPEVVTTP